MAPAQIDKGPLTIAEPKRLRDKAHMKFVGSRVKCLPIRTKALIKQLKHAQSCFDWECASRNLKNYMPERIVTGGAGFVESSLALAFKRSRSTATVVVLDNLKRRGSELALERLRANGVEFAHGDVRGSDDLAAIGPVELLIEASAKPCVHAGGSG